VRWPRARGRHGRLSPPEAFPARRKPSHRLIPTRWSSSLRRNRSYESRRRRAAPSTAPATSGIGGKRVSKPSFGPPAPRRRDCCSATGASPARSPSPPESMGDHLIPRHDGGSDSIENHLPMCRSRSSSKGRRDVLDWGESKDRDPLALGLDTLTLYARLKFRWLEPWRAARSCPGLPGVAAAPSPRRTALEPALEVRSGGGTRVSEAFFSDPLEAARRWVGQGVHVVSILPRLFDNGGKKAPRPYTEWKWDDPPDRARRGDSARWRRSRTSGGITQRLRPPSSLESASDASTWVS
jgi:5-methylcytosine-specific restriction endonuclease McrA